MTTAPVLTPPPSPDAPSIATAARVRFRQPIAPLGIDPVGFVDAAWWPRSRDLTAELPALLDVLTTAGREITRVTYSLAAWGPAPRRVLIDGRMLRLGGFVTGDPGTIRLSDAWGRERIDVLVIAPETDAATADRILVIASEGDPMLRAADINAAAMSDNPVDANPERPTGRHGQPTADPATHRAGAA